MSTKNAKNVNSLTTAQTPIKITVPEAAKIAGVTPGTIRKWIKDFEKHGLGSKMAGRYHVYKDKLDLITSGKITYENQGRPAKKN